VIRNLPATNCRIAPSALLINQLIVLKMALSRSQNRWICLSAVGLAQLVSVVSAEGYSPGFAPVDNEAGAVAPSDEALYDAVFGEQEDIYEEEQEYKIMEDGSIMYKGSDGNMYTDMTNWEETSVHLLNEAFSKQRVWRDEEELDESPLRSIVRDDLVLLFGEAWGDELYQGWEGTVDAEDEEEDVFEGHAFRPPPVDKYFENMINIINDPDCMEGEVDMASPDFTVEKAIQIWHKCHVLVIRNVFTNPEGVNVVEDFRSNVTSFVYDVNSGRVSDNGTTSYSEPMYMHDVEVNRWDMLLPKSLAQHPQVLAPPFIMQIMEDERVLGDSFKCLSFGVVMAESGASSQMWHQDERPMFGDGSIFHNKHGGHEQPAMSIVALAPLLNMTRAHGPTEFCVGSSAVNGLFTDIFEFMTWDSAELKEQVMELYEDFGPEQFLYGFCPSRMWRSPTLNAGDMVLWDYNLNHRAGPNNSKDFRSALYTSYSRPQSQDRTFESHSDQPGNGPRQADGSADLVDFANRSIRKGRFAKIELPLSSSNAARARDGATEACVALDGQACGSSAGTAMPHSGFLSQL
jgi:ectoine hydroxylase-related dioxygenase (phytanoyl-CoA dioxygenase family)